MTFAIVLKSVAATALLMGTGLSWAALTTTLPTSLLNANGKLTFSADAVNVLDTVGISRTALGTATQLDQAGTIFNLPITSATTSLSIFPPSLTAVSGASMGSAIDLGRGAGNDLIFGNAQLDLSQGKLYADVWSNGVKSHLNIFNFQVAQGLTLSLKGGLSLKEELNHLTLTSDGVEAFASALHLPKAIKGFLADIQDFGSISINISPTLRMPLGSVSGKPYNPPPVPEPGTWLLMGLGLVAAAMTARRSRGAAS